MDGYDKLRAATMALSADQLRNCVESLVLSLYAREDSNGKVLLTTERNWPDNAVAGVIQVLADYGLHPDNLNAVKSGQVATAGPGTRAAKPNVRAERRQAVRA